MIEADHFRRNPASGAVLRKLGFKYIGSKKQNGQYGHVEDLELYQITKEIYETIPPIA